VGGDEAYLILKYSNLDYIDSSKLFARLEPLRIQYDIKTSFSIHENGITETINQSALSPSDWFLDRDLISLREIILKDSGKTFLYLWDKAKLNEEKFKNFFYLRQFRIPHILADQDDKFKLNFAKLSEKNGELILAGNVLSSMKNLSAYKKFLLRHRSNEKVYNVTNENWAYSHGHFSLHHKKLPFLIRKLDSDSKKMKEDLFDVLRVLYFMPEKDFFNIALNQSGLEKEFAEISQKYFLALDNNKIVNSLLADNHWIFLYNKIIDKVGKDETEKILSGFNVNLRYFSDNVPETVSWFLALREILPYVNNKTRNVPKKPINLIDGFEWEKFVEVAQIIKQRQKNNNFWINFDEQELFFAAELLFALGEIDLSVDVIENIDDPKAVIRIKQSFMKRLDKHCKNYLSFPGSSLWNAGDEGMYIFTK
tara:strand:- start:271 stop:1542 length:1272 start_codon:yes stop_codon:yes gene_type:complete